MGSVCIGRNHTHWMQDRNLKDGNSFGNTNITGFECGVKLVRAFLPVGCHIVGQRDSALS